MSKTHKQATLWDVLPDSVKREMATSPVGVAKSLTGYKHPIEELVRWAPYMGAIARGHLATSRAVQMTRLIIEGASRWITHRTAQLGPGRIAKSSVSEVSPLWQEDAKCNYTLCLMSPQLAAPLMVKYAETKPLRTWSPQLSLHGKVITSADLAVRGQMIEVMIAPMIDAIRGIIAGESRPEDDIQEIDLPMPQDWVTVYYANRKYKIPSLICGHLNGKYAGWTYLLSIELILTRNQKEVRHV